MVNFMSALLKLFLFEVEFSKSIFVHPIVIRNQFYKRSRVFNRNTVIYTCTCSLSSMSGSIRFFEIIHDYRFDGADCRPDSFASPVDRTAILGFERGLIYSDLRCEHL